jgi:hypothetical protein
MTMSVPLHLYSNLPSKVIRRLRDIPWRLRELRDLLIPGEFARIYPLIRNQTGSSQPRLRALYEAVDRVCRLGIQGDIVECGAARGGSAGLLGLAMRERDKNRRLWVFDTFAGLPPPSKNDPDYDTAKHYTGSCFGSLEDVQKFFTEIGIIDSAKLIKGLFQETLIHADVGTIAVLHLDGDWYDSTMICLDCLYDRVQSGGVIQIDDYGHWAGARKAVHDFFDRRNMKVRLDYIDYTGRQFIKP